MSKMGTRERYTKKHTEFPVCANKKDPWNDAEKEKLLCALEKYGYKDIDRICRELPHKTKGAITSIINRYVKEAKVAMSARSDLVEQWVRVGGIREQDPLISQALKFIALFETHPKPEESAGCDFRALYDVLSKATMGEPTFDVSRMTHETISYIMAQTVHAVWPYYQTEITSYVESLQKSKNHKTYSRKSHVLVVPKGDDNSD